MRQQTVPIESSGRVLVQETRDEVFKLGRDGGFFVVDGRRVVGENHLHELGQGRTHERGPPRRALVHDAAERPQVGCEGVNAALPEELRRHVARGASLGQLSRGAPRGSHVSHLPRQSKTAQFQSTVLVHQHVARLEVAVERPGAVKHAERGDQVAGKDGDGSLRKAFILLQQTEEVAAHAVLQD